MKPDHLLKQNFILRSRGSFEILKILGTMARRVHHAHERSILCPAQTFWFAVLQYHVVMHSTKPDIFDLAGDIIQYLKRDKIIYALSFLMFTFLEGHKLWKNNMEQSTIKEQFETNRRHRTEYYFSSSDEISLL